MNERRRVELALLANQIREWSLRMVHCANSGHIGGSLSVADILAYLYFEEMNIDPSRPDDPERDRFVLSKGHATPALYSTLALRGFFPLEELSQFRKSSSRLSGHAEMHVPGVDMSTGSLGQGLSAAVGMALAAKLDGRNNRVFAITGDGELQEGQIWEALMSAAQFGLDQLTVIVDNNHLQIDGSIEEIMSPYPLREKFESFNWEVVEINGHDFQEIEAAFRQSRAKKLPRIIIAKTIKGKAVSFMENVVDWHGETPNELQCEQALRELRQNEKNLKGGCNRE